MLSRVCVISSGTHQRANQIDKIGVAIALQNLPISGVAAIFQNAPHLRKKPAVMKVRTGFCLFGETKFIHQQGDIPHLNCTPGSFRHALRDTSLPEGGKQKSDLRCAYTPLNKNLNTATDQQTLLPLCNRPQNPQPTPHAPLLSVPIRRAEACARRALGYAPTRQSNPQNRRGCQISKFLSSGYRRKRSFPPYTRKPKNSCGTVDWRSGQPARLPTSFLELFSCRSRKKCIVPP